MTLHTRLPLRAGPARHALALAGAIVALASIPSAAHAAASVPGESLPVTPTKSGAVIADSAAAGGQALKLWSNGAAAGQLSQTTASSRLMIRARGEQCSGAPQMAVDVDGVRVLTTTVGATSYTDYAVTTAIGAGSHAVKVSYLNDLLSGCDRNLIVDTVTSESTATPPPQPVPTTGVFEAETMTLPARTGVVVTDSSASAGKSLNIWGPAAATRSQSLDAGKLVVRAKGEQCAGAPRLSVKVDGAEVLGADVTATAWTDYTATVATAGGMRNLSVAFTNDVNTTACDRNLLVDRVAVTGSATPTPTPTPTPTTTPTPTPPSSGTVTFNGDFSKGLAPWNTKIHAERISIVDDPILGSQRKVAKFTVYNTDTGPTENPRAQLEGPSNLVSGGEHWIGWSTLFPTDFPTLPSGGWLTLQSVYGAPFAGAGPLATRVTGSALNFQRNATYAWDIPWQQGIQRGRWSDFVYHIKLSANASIGFVEIYMNTGAGWQQQTLKGQKRLYMKTLDSSNGGGANNFRLNSYRKVGMFNVTTLYHAEPKIGTTFAAVAPHSY